MQVISLPSTGPIAESLSDRLAPTWRLGQAGKCRAGQSFKCDLITDHASLVLRFGTGQAVY